jgi:hypothetical protein
MSNPLADVPLHLRTQVGQLFEKFYNQLQQPPISGSNITGAFDSWVVDPICSPSAPMARAMLTFFTDAPIHGKLASGEGSDRFR